MNNVLFSTTFIGVGLSRYNLELKSEGEEGSETTLCPFRQVLVR